MSKIKIPILDRKYWSDRYQDNSTGWDIGNVSTPIKAYVDQLEDRELFILIPGAGNSYEAEYLHQLGFNNVYVIDIAPEPLANLKKRCPTFPDEHLIEGDFFKHHASYQLIIEQTFFCALHPVFRQAYAEKMYELLVPGGKLAGVLFNDRLNSDRPPFGGFQPEYELYFKPYFEFKHFTTCYNSIGPRAGRELFMVLLRRQSPTFEV